MRLHFLTSAAIITDHVFFREIAALYKLQPMHSGHSALGVCLKVQSYAF